MNLPIDASKAPYRDKYLDEETPLLARWIIFGWDPTHGSFQVDDAHDPIFTGLTYQQAEQLCMARKVFVDEVLRIINKREPS